MKTEEMPMDYRSVILARVEYIRAELAAVEALLRLEGDAPAAAAPTRAGAPRVEAEPLPPEPEAGDDAIDPARAAEILGVARQTVDRRLKDGRTDVPGGPRDTSRGNVRARWRWSSESAVKTWWAAVRR